MSMSLIAGVVITLAVLGSVRLVTARHTERAFEIVESRRRRRGSGSGLFMLLGVGLCAGVLFAGYRWLPAAELDLATAQTSEPRPTLRLAETFDSYHEMQQSQHQTR
jgi:hypothetical protein